MPTVAERVAAAVAPVLADLDLLLHDVEHTGTTIRVTIDTVDPAGRLDVDSLAAATRAISRLMDELDPLDGAYTLEVSSPGLERPLRRPAEFQRFIGSAITGKTKPSVEGDRRFSGELTEADDDGIVVGGRRLAYGDIDKARTVFEWGPTPKPGQPRTRKATTS